jgi:outer membrane protein assembly factor BamB
MALYLIIFAALVGLILLIAPSIGAARLKYPFWRVFALFLLAMSSIGFIKGIGQAVSSCIPGSYTNVAAPLASSLTIFSGQGFPPRVTALEARNGALRWQHDLAPDNTEGTGQLTVSHNVVYVLGQEKTPHQEQPNFPNGGLTAYRASNGTMLWHVSLPGPDALSLSEMNEAPLLADGLVYVGTSASLGLTGRIYAFHTTDGTLAWSVLILHYLPDWQNRSLVAGGGLLFFSTLDGSAGQTMAFRAQDGRLIWQVPIGSMRPLLSEGILYLPNESGLQALRASDGKFLWTQPLNVGGFPSLRAC